MVWNPTFSTLMSNKNCEALGLTMSKPEVVSLVVDGDNKIN